MSVPLERIYDFVIQVLYSTIPTNNIIIYHFPPDGTRNLKDIFCSYVPSSNIIGHQTAVQFICNDQEPLNYDLYTGDEFIENMFEHFKQIKGKIQSHSRTSRFLSFDYEASPGDLDAWINDHKEIFKNYNLRLGMIPNGIIDKIILINSEQRSKNLEKYESDDYVGCYWWSHAVIARDWYRFAEHDGRFKNRLLNGKYDFLIFNRAWTGTREYRLKFAELLVDKRLHKKSLMKFNPIDDGTYYRKHKFKNQQFSNIIYQLENYFPKNIAPSSASADYDIDSYTQTNIEVVLETLFDDDRLHLTEKTLRPIACGHPFILMATHGSLEYLRNYGFRTFSPWIDETYDTIEDPVARLNAVVDEMERISNLSHTEKENMLLEMQKVTEYNKKLFFSSDFLNSIVDELKTNAIAAYEIAMKNITGKYWINFRRELLKRPSNRQYMELSRPEGRQKTIQMHLTLKSMMNK